MEREQRAEPAEPAEPAEGAAEPAGPAPADLTAEGPATAQAVPADPDVPAAAGTGQATQVPARSDRSPRDMAISLLVLLLPIALLLAFYRVVLDGDQPVRVDPAPAISQARVARAFPVSEPTGLSGGWRPVAASFRTVDGGRTLRIGYLSPEGRGVQVVQSDVPAHQLLPAELTGKGQPQGVTEVAGRNWQRYSARAGERALVLLEPHRTVVVVGDAAEGELRALASAMR